MEVRVLSSAPALYLMHSAFFSFIQISTCIIFRIPDLQFRSIPLNSRI